MKALSLAVLLCAVFFTASPVFAQGTEWVPGYYMSNGTYVAGHYRTTPDGDFYNNWSTYPNVNPYTGERGTKRTPPHPNSFWGGFADGFLKGYADARQRKRQEADEKSYQSSVTAPAPVPPSYLPTPSPPQVRSNGELIYRDTFPDFNKSPMYAKDYTPEKCQQLLDSGQRLYETPGNTTLTRITMSDGLVYDVLLVSLTKSRAYFKKGGTDYYAYQSDIVKSEPLAQEPAPAPAK